MISIIIPVYNEEENITPLYHQLIGIADKIDTDAVEFIFVDDGSTDGSLGFLEKIKENDERIEIIKFSRNFGSHAAIAAGLHFCRGNAAVLYPADMQDPPELIEALCQAWLAGNKVVWGYRRSRPNESILLRICALAYYRVLNLIANTQLPCLGVDTVLVDRDVINNFNKVSEKNSSYVMLISWMGFKSTGIPYDKVSRKYGKSKWTFYKKLKLLIDSMVSFSYVPIRTMTVLGGSAACLGMLYGFVVLWNFFYSEPVSGWSSLIVITLTIGGLQMCMLGMLGEYLWRTYDESRGRPPYIIEQNSLSKSA